MRLPGQVREDVRTCIECGYAWRVPRSAARRRIRPIFMFSVAPRGQTVDRAELGREVGAISAEGRGGRDVPALSQMRRRSFHAVPITRNPALTTLATWVDTYGRHQRARPMANSRGRHKDTMRGQPPSWTCWLDQPVAQRARVPIRPPYVGSLVPAALHLWAPERRPGFVRQAGICMQRSSRPGDHLGTTRHASDRTISMSAHSALPHCDRTDQRKRLARSPGVKRSPVSAGE
jgi:hypothetical protein